MVYITFDKKSKQFILDCFNISVDKEGYLINSDNSKIISVDKTYVTKKEFGGVQKGSQIILKENIPTLIKYMKNVQKK